LSAFLLGVRQELMIESALAGKALTLTLDHPPRNPTADQTDEATRRDLEQQLGDRFHAAWALTGRCADGAPRAGWPTPPMSL